MSINIRTDFMQHAELFGNPVLFTNWLIQRDTIPKDWYCYDLRGTRQSPNVCWPRAPSCPCRKTPVSPFVTFSNTS